MRRLFRDSYKHCYRINCLPNPQIYLFLAIDYQPHDNLHQALDPFNR
jgi:hypothetical protein